MSASDSDTDDVAPKAEPGTPAMLLFVLDKYMTGKKSQVEVVGPLLYSARVGPARCAGHTPLAATGAGEGAGAGAGAGASAGASAAAAESAGVESAGVTGTSSVAETAMSHAAHAAGAGASAPTATDAPEPARGDLRPVLTVFLRIDESATGFEPRDVEEFECAPHAFTVSRDAEAGATEVTVHVDAAGVPVVARDTLCTNGTALEVETVATSDTGHVITTAAIPQQLSAGSVVLVRPQTSAVVAEAVTTDGFVALQFTYTDVKAGEDAPADEADVRTRPWSGFEPFSRKDSPGTCVTSVAMLHRGVVTVLDEFDPPLELHMHEGDSAAKEGEASDCHGDSDSDSTRDKFVEAVSNAREPVKPRGELYQRVLRETMKKCGSGLSSEDTNELFKESLASQESDLKSIAYFTRTGSDEQQHTCLALVCTTSKQQYMAFQVLIDFGSLDDCPPPPMTHLGAVLGDAVGDVGLAWPLPWPGLAAALDRTIDGLKERPVHESPDVVVRPLMDHASPSWQNGGWRGGTPLVSTDGTAWAHVWAMVKANLKPTLDSTRHMATPKQRKRFLAAVESDRATICASPLFFCNPKARANPPNEWEFFVQVNHLEPTESAQEDLVLVHVHCTGPGGTTGPPAYHSRCHPWAGFEPFGQDPTQGGAVWQVNLRHTYTHEHCRPDGRPQGAMQEIEYPLAEVSRYTVVNPAWELWRGQVAGKPTPDLESALDAAKWETARRKPLQTAYKARPATTESSATIAAMSTSQLRGVLVSELGEAGVEAIERKALEEAYVRHDMSLGKPHRTSPPKRLDAKKAYLHSASPSRPFVWSRDPSPDAVQEAKTDAPAVRRLLQLAKAKYDACAPWPITETFAVTAAVADAVTLALAGPAAPCFCGRGGPLFRRVWRAGAHAPFTAGDVLGAVIEFQITLRVGGEDRKLHVEAYRAPGAGSGAFKAVALEGERTCRPWQTLQPFGQPPSMSGTTSFGDRRNLALRTFDDSSAINKVTVGHPNDAAGHIELVPRAGGAVKWWIPLTPAERADPAHVAVHRLMRQCYDQYMDQLHIKTYDDIKRRVNCWI